MKNKTKMVIVATSIAASAGATAGLELAAMERAIKNLPSGNRIKIKKEAMVKKPATDLIGRISMDLIGRT